MVERVRLLLTILSYGVIGFVLGISGISVYTDTPFTIRETTSLQENRFANACLPDQKNEEGEIFFLSCGGIF
ncbi:hypothetical protein A3A39_02270 [Candidatus Kaiserbacteria bacterium RIFCSPLOWO2_01_FULL_54_13]|uniref:Uncharacterized protein n=1 Tax=Candidatus Kaiserbacteria bacterium RIFCSPLOWO2_01_FULL_54_13 TaxID=1798512 RepID=A0A1F6F187_9BACT|nr:MAG: hypothetical protein A3A39_02270 [Candidatus Kaiserbacteria bacterium RIFCSPLOWO2_01_FULL_54_13]